ncbi:c-type cytochrome [Granulosicoccus antarcticus]|uniref:Cytochrome c-L n=1 Tax=Granulosicoccus antarcticus IMCC3135 TaxID=1192854 RepID=A0A2Z2NLF0_9GAMM|nr:c-type cytochrome [Granulosicoccus antarcticus]ASJ71993.1 Cytochrome c-L [Granulosicoccus antarcticus IMCC3135]
MSKFRHLLPICLMLAVPAIDAAEPAKSSDAVEKSPDTEQVQESGALEFLHALTNKPLDMNMRPEQVLTPAVLEFHETGENPYSGNAERIAAGEKLYKKQCQACHLKDGKGRIGPNLTDDTWTRSRTDTELGRFEVVYGGGAGAMQAFGLRMDQDGILEVLAFIETFRAQ